MGKNKLRKFAEMEGMDCVLQYPFAVLKDKPFPLKGKWRSDYFGNDNPVVLELGCGKGEYTVGLALSDPAKNYIGIDIKGARMYSGAKAAQARGLDNAAFLRTTIELLESFFAPGEVDEIWITFPDPQMKKVRKRLTSTRFLDLYRRVLRPGGLVHLKTDSPFLYTYTTAMLAHNGIPTLAATADLYADELRHRVPDIRTHYERQWLDRGLPIKYVMFALEAEPALTEPDIEIPFDTYRSYSRGVLQGVAEPDDE